MTVLSPSCGSIPDCSQYNIYQFILKDGPTGPGSGVWGYIIFWEEKLVLHSAASLFLFTSYVTQSWLSRQSWRWRSPAAQGRAQRIDGTYFQSHSAISWQQIQRSWRKRREMDGNIYTSAESPTVSRQKFGVMFKVKPLLDLLFEYQTLNLRRLEMSLWTVWTFLVFVWECFIFKDKIVSKAPEHYTVSWTAVRHITKTSISV